MDNLGRLVRLIVTGIPGEWLGTVCDLAEKLASHAGCEWYEELKKFLHKQPCWAAVEGMQGYLKALFEYVEVPESDGTETLPGLPASGKPTPAMTATVWEQILSGAFTKLFGSLGAKRCCWTTSQVAVFALKHKNKLRNQGYTTFFELEDGSVACVRVHADNPSASTYKFSRADVWDALSRRRLVSLHQVSLAQVA